MILLEFDPKIGIWCEDPDSLDKLKKNCFGEEKEGKLFLDIEEALYIISLQNGIVRKGSDPLGFNQLASHYAREDPRLIVKYNTYRDWRDRGLILKRIEYIDKKGNKQSSKKYPSKPLALEKLDANVYWYPVSLYSILEDEYLGKKLFEDHWIGQYGIYKQTRGSLLKLDFLETIFLNKHMGLTVLDPEGKKLTYKEIMKQVVKVREYSEQLYEIYEDWRLQGFVVKTGFKFGSHFRIYFPGASPAKEGKWTHSKHVLHVFPKDQKLLISEWARAVRVAHSVKKTFLLGIPELTEKDLIDYPADFLAYRRKKEGGNLVRETTDDNPRFLLVSVSEDEHIGGIELASLLHKANKLGVELILSISDRETSITYYVLKKIVLPGSKYEYYEIEWDKP